MVTAAVQESAVLVGMAKKYVAADQAVEALEEQLKALKVRREIAEKSLVEQMTTEGVKSFRSMELGGFRQQVEVYPNITDREVLNAYVKKRKSLEFLYTVSINGTRFKSYVKELMQHSKPIPPGVDPFLKTVVRRFK